MEAIVYVKTVNAWLLIIVSASIPLMLTYFGLKYMICSNEEKAQYKDKIIKTLQGGIIAISLSAFISFVMYFVGINLG